MPSTANRVFIVEFSRETITVGTLRRGGPQNLQQVTAAPEGIRPRRRPDC